MKEFTRGQKVKLAELTTLTGLEVGVGASFPGSQTVDVSCFGVDADNKLSDDRYFVFYNQKSSPDSSIVALGPQGGDRETFRVELSRLPQAIKKLVFTASLDGAGTMAQLTRGQLRLTAGGAEVGRFPLSGADFGDEKAIIVGELYLKDEWRFAAVGQGFNGGLGALLRHFGGEEIKAPVSAPTPPPTPAAPPSPPVNIGPVNIGKVTLEKKGDKQAVSLRKGGGVQPIHVNLNWDNTGPKRRGLFGLGAPSAPDLDLGCMYRLADGARGVVQPLGGNFGAKDRPPYIHLDKDDRSGAAADGENLQLYRPDLIDLVMVFAFIYEGAGDFSEVGGRLTIHDGTGNEIFMRLSSPDARRGFCAICTIEKKGDRIEVTKEERYFSGHPEADRQYGFGFNWKAGSK